MSCYVLVVEDRPVARNGLVRLLSQQGFHAVPAAHGREALDYLQCGGHADVILLDLMMPVMDGWEFRREQLRDPWLADIPVIALSVTGDPAMRGVLPAIALQKPVDLGCLIATINDVCALQQRRQRDERLPDAS